MRRENVLDLRQGFLAEVRSFQQLDFGTLHEVADVQDALCLEAVCRPHGQLQVMNRPVNTLFGDVHYDLIGKAFGCHAERVTEPNEVGPALDRAIAAKETAVIDMVTDPDAGKLRKEDPRVQTIAFSDLVASRNSQYKAEVV